MRPVTQGRRLVLIIGALILASAADASYVLADGPRIPTEVADVARMIPGRTDGAVVSDLSSRRVVMPAALHELLAAVHSKVPPFSRQTGLPCSACHYQFPQLTPFGRQFKLNGYSLVGLKPIVEPNAKKEAPLSLIPIAPLGIMLQASGTHLGRTPPGTQNDVAAMPQQLSVFLGGALSTHIGALLQATYAGASGTFGIDNSDIR
jgi:hypothetical protein